MTTRMSLRARLASSACRAVAALSRAAGRGDGSVIGGRVALLIDPGLLTHLTAGRQVVLISATNGKTTTTRLTAAAVGVLGPVATNSLGANMPAGQASALARAGHTPYAVLEVDEHYLPAVTDATSPRVIALLNLSRDQLDRAKEVAMIAQVWRDALRGRPVRLVANADDPMVVWAASVGTDVTWVAAGQRWHDDSWVCPECGSAIQRAGEQIRAGAPDPIADLPGGPAAGGGAPFPPPDPAGADDAPGADGAVATRVALAPGDWRCTGCALRRPDPEWSVEGECVVAPDGRRLLLDLQLPGRVNRANAATALAVAAQLGVDPARCVPRLSEVTSVAGRYARVDRDGRTIRLLLAKNPAGWLEAFDMAARVPTLLSINARDPDGLDTSWLFDVDFSVLAGRPVYITGDRAYDLAVRLEVAGVPFTHVPSFGAAVAAVPPGPLEVIANYTAFQDIRAELDRVN